ncbi:MAG: DUF6569 family protein [bacterium]
MVRKIGVILSIALIGSCLIGCLGITGSRSVNDVITLLKAKVGEVVIKEHIANKGMSFDLSTEDIVKLKKVGASDELLAYMIGKATGDFPFELGEEFMVHSPTTYEHLSIYPVFRKTSLEIGDYITLDQAQKNKVVIISELSSASVPTVLIKNTGSKPIYIMAGEIIIGGKQDRMVSFDILIPGGKEVQVEVRCVEHGRWHGKSVEFSSGGAVGSKGVRNALQFKEQTDVWAEVSKKCAEIDVASQSGTYGAILSSDEVEKKSKPFLDAMNQGMRDEAMVGMIMALNGEVVCVDIFANPKFFAEIKEKLLKAYVLDAISTEEKNTKIASKKEILAFFDELKDAKTAELKKYSANCNTELESDELIGNESRDKDGKLQHLNLYKK